MARLDVHAGDFKVGPYHEFVQAWNDKNSKLIMKKKFFREKIPISRIADLELASEESVKRLGGTVGWGIAGGLLLGPVGLLAGLLSGGQGKNVTFVCKLKDGRRFMATAPSKVYTKLSAAVF